MSFKYIQSYYGITLKRGGRVVDKDGREGVITSATHYVHVRLDGNNRALSYHPDDLVYLYPGARETEEPEK